MGPSRPSKEHMVRLYHGESGQAFKMRDQAVYRVAADGAFVRQGKSMLTKKERNKLKTCSK